MEIIERGFQQAFLKRLSLPLTYVQVCIGWSVPQAHRLALYLYVILIVKHKSSLNISGYLLNIFLIVWRPVSVSIFVYTLSMWRG